MQAHHNPTAPLNNRLSQHQNNLRHNPGLLDSIGLNPSLDQLPSDLENLQPTMMHDDNSMLQDLNSLLSSHDIVEDLRISDDDKGSLDHIFSFTSNSLSTFLSNANNQKAVQSTDFSVNNEDSNSSETSTVFIEKIKLDSSLTNGNKSEVTAIGSQTKQKVEGNKSQITEPILPMSDDELLASKLNIQMTADEILKECESYGVNGIQTNSLLKVGRLVPAAGRDLGILKNTKKMFMYGTIPSRAKENENYETIAKKFKASEEVSELSESESDEEGDLSDVDEALPSGASGAASSYLKRSAIRDSELAGCALAAPSVVLENKKDAQSAHLQYFCLSNPITVVRNIGKNIN